jgi:methylated-DNA-[protein]-cysteine S-methyltransferase
MNKIYSKTYHSPCGDMILGSFEGKLCLCDWLREGHNEIAGRRLRRLLNAELVDEPSPIVEQAEKELNEYFAGTRRAFDLPLLFVGTDFQKNVWTGLLTIPYGKTISYGAFARKLGCPSAVRAVAAANGANAISIFVPCHRVIGSDNSLTGYGGGIAAKRKLLEIEGALK